jgi:hypothetical protein
MAIPFINIIMDPQCILWWPYPASLYHPSIGMPALGLKHVIIFVDVCVQLLGEIWFVEKNEGKIPSISEGGWIQISSQGIILRNILN